MINEEKNEVKGIWLGAKRGEFERQD